ncbi:MAG: hypothetical protein MZW92_04605 [Comamonadaceae bacterium]|nr:hypothetical protein [Comamonadaceae bacterium]
MTERDAGAGRRHERLPDQADRQRGAARDGGALGRGPGRAGAAAEPRRRRPDSAITPANWNDESPARAAVGRFGRELTVVPVDRESVSVERDLGAHACRRGRRVAVSADRACRAARAPPTRPRRGRR